MSPKDPARLADLDDVLTRVKSWAGIEDRGGGTLYLKRKPFLHFHLGHDSRRADVRGADGWTQVELPEPASSADRRRLLDILEERYSGG